MVLSTTQRRMPRPLPCPTQSAIEWSTIRHSVREQNLEPDQPDIEPPTEFDNIWLVVPQQSSVAEPTAHPELISAEEVNNVFTINIYVPAIGSAENRHHEIHLTLPSDSTAGNPSINQIIKT